MTLLTTSEAAERIGITRKGITKAIADGRIHTSKAGRIHLIADSECARFARERKGPGRPKRFW